MCFEFFTKGAIVSEGLIIVGSSFHNVGTAADKARLPVVSLVYTSNHKYNTKNVRNSR